MNEEGQAIVDYILFDPSSIMQVSPVINRGRYAAGMFIEIWSDYGRGPGVRYTMAKDGRLTFTGFLEPR